VPANDRAKFTQEFGKNRPSRDPKFEIGAPYDEYQLNGS